MINLLFLCLCSAFLASADGQGTPQALSHVEQVTMMILHNMNRKEANNRINMECFEDTNSAMAAHAQKLAETCPTELNETFIANSGYGLAMYKAETKTKGLQEYVDTALDLLNTGYSYDDNNWRDTKPSATEDNHFRQEMTMRLKLQRAPLATFRSNHRSATLETVWKPDELISKESDERWRRELRFRAAYKVFWFQAKELGCGRAICDGKTIVICAYTYRQNKDRKPFIQVPGLGDCAACPSGKDNCDDRLCCTPHDGEQSGSQGSSGGQSSGACGAVPKKLDELIRAWDPIYTTNYLVPSSMGFEAYRVAALPAVNYKGPIGKIAAEKDAGCPQLVPIRHIYSKVQTSDYYIVDEALYKAKLVEQTELNEDRGIIGYAVRGENVCGATVPVYEFFLPGLGYMQLQAGYEAINVLQLKQGAWRWQGVSFWIWA